MLKDIKLEDVMIFDADGKSRGPPYEAQRLLPPIQKKN